MTNYSLRGVQFLTNWQGQKTSALIDLTEHSAFWQEVLAEYNNDPPFQFLVNQQGEKISVILDFAQHGELWEDIYDSLTTEDLEKEPGGISLSKFVQQLQEREKISA